MRGATRLAMKGGLGRGPQTTPLEGGSEEPRRDPPPPSSPPLPPRQPARFPETDWGARGKSPLPLKGPRRPGGNAAKPVLHAPQRPCRPAPTETATGRRTRASTQGRHTDHTRDQQLNTNWSSMEATPSMN